MLVASYRYWTVLILVSLLGASVALLPLIFVLNTKQDTAHLDQDPQLYKAKYHQIKLAQFDLRGQKTFSMLARHMLQRGESWLLSRPQLACGDITQADTNWYIESSFAQMGDTMVHFFGDVDIIDDGDQPIHLTAHDFWYQRQQGGFLANGDVVYQKGSHVVHAESAHGNLPERQLYLDKTRGFAKKVK